MRTLVGLFENLNDARATIDDLATCGIAPEAVSVISPKTDGVPREIGSLHLSALDLPSGEHMIAQGPLVAMLTPSTATERGDLIVASLVRMGVPQMEAAQYVDAVRRGMTLETVMVDDAKAQACFDIMQQHGISHTRTERMEALERERIELEKKSLEGLKGEAEVKIPVLEEHLRVGKRDVPAGGIRVSTYVTTTPVSEQVTLREEHVGVERRPADRPADEQAFREQTIEVTAMAEEPVVAKEARVIEEVIVKKDVSEETTTIKENLRKTDVRVEPLSASFDETAYRAHFDQSYGRTTGDRYKYEQVLPAYRFGHSLRDDRRYAGSDWAKIEPNARDAWERKQPGTWNKFKAAIRHAWEKTKS
jgi:uncharacterized protein (TIGR02271 family)